MTLVYEHWELFRNGMYPSEWNKVTRRLHAASLLRDGYVFSVSNAIQEYIWGWQ